MRSPRGIARRLGWPEARWREPTRGLISFPVPPPTIAAGPVSMHLEQRAKPKLLIGRVSPGKWMWIIRDPGRVSIAKTWGTAPSQPAALALGLAALDTTRSH